jgi:hypothetical protein
MTQATQSPDFAAIAAMRKDMAENSAVNFAKGILCAELAKADILKALDGADYPVFESVREIWVTSYMTEREAKRDAAKVQWSRMCKEFAIEKPKSTSAEAVKKDEAREAEKQRLANLTADEINTAKADALKLAQISLQAGDLKVSKSATANIEKLEAEVLRRHKEANKGQEDILSKKRKHITDLLKTANLETLTKIEALLGSATSNQADGQHLTDAATQPLVQAAA